MCVAVTGLREALKHRVPGRDWRTDTKSAHERWRAAAELGSQTTQLRLRRIPSDLFPERSRREDLKWNLLFIHKKFPIASDKHIRTTGHRF